jgi:hypothetical protein
LIAGGQLLTVPARRRRVATSLALEGLPERRVGNRIRESAIIDGS